MNILRFHGRGHKTSKLKCRGCVSLYEGAGGTPSSEEGVKQLCHPRYEIGQKKVG